MDNWRTRCNIVPMRVFCHGVLEFGMFRCKILLCMHIFTLMQNFINIVLLLIKEAFLKQGDESILKTCIKVLSFATNKSQGDLQVSANQLITDSWRSSVETAAEVSILNRFCLDCIFWFLCTHPSMGEYFEQKILPYVDLRLVIPVDLNPWGLSYVRMNIWAWDSCENIFFQGSHHKCKAEMLDVIVLGL